MRPRPSPREQLAAMRRQYEDRGLDEADLADTWLEQFERWLADTVAAGVTEPNAAVLATATPQARPSARMVLVKAADERGLVFFTDRRSRKGHELAANPQAALVMPWHDLGRQVRASGAVEPVADAEAEAYFASRPHGSRLSAAASRQSEVVGAREDLLAARERLAERHPPGGPVPRPADWGGFRVVPEEVEFWQGRPDRLHDRLRFRREGEGWVVERLAP